MTGAPLDSNITSIEPPTARAAIMRATVAAIGRPDETVMAAGICRAIEAELAASGFAIVPQMAADELPYPKDLTGPLSDALGEMIFTTGPIAEAFRANGHAIPNKAEAEQAFVLHWLVRLALQHGARWRPIAGAELGRLYVALQAKRPREPQQ